MAARIRFSDALRTMYSPAGDTDHPADYVGSQREASDAELAHEERDSWSGLDDFDTTPRRLDSPRTYGPAPVATTGTAAAREVDCPKCLGRGTVMIGYRYQRAVQCLRCTGTGKVSARSAAATKARATAEKNKAQWAIDNAVLIDWLRAARDRGFRLAGAYLEDIEAYGTLKPDKVEKVEGWMSGDAARKAAREAERAAAAPGVDSGAAGIKEVLERAKANGLPRPSLRLDGFVFSLAPASGVNAGAVYVKTKDEGESLYLGKVAGGKFLSSRDCPADLTPRIVAAASNPAEAAVTFGHLSGVCSCCGRKLDNPVSVARGIGPVCATKFGF